MTHVESRQSNNDDEFADHSSRIIDMLTDLLEKAQTEIDDMTTPSRTPHTTARR